MATSFFYIYAMATSYFYIYEMATIFFYIDIDIYKLTERPVVLLNGIFCFFLSSAFYLLLPVPLVSPSREISSGNRSVADAIKVCPWLSVYF